MVRRWMFRRNTQAGSFTVAPIGASCLVDRSLVYCGSDAPGAVLLTVFAARTAFSRLAKLSPLVAIFSPLDATSRQR